MYQCHLSSESPNQSSCEESDDRYTCLCDQTHVTSNYAYKTCECSFGHGNLNMGLSNSTESEQCTADDKKHFNVSSDVNFQGNMGSPSFLDCESPEHSNAMSHHCHLSPQTVSVQIHNSAPDCSHMSDIVNQPCSSKQLITCSNDSASCNEGPNENVYSHAVELNEIQPDSISHNQEPDMVENEKGAYNSLPNCDPNEENCSLSSDISQSGCYSNTKGRNSIVHLSNTNENPCSHITTDSGICHSNCSTVCACSHVCSICHVKVQVEWACASGSQKSGNGRSTKPFSFPKRVRHKPKAPTKDVSGSKKKKSPWSFRLNCRFKSNKSESAQEGGFSCLNMNCVSCVCPRYQISEPEQAYKNKSLTDSSNGMSHHSTLGNCSNLNPEAASTSKSEESNREEGSDVIKLQQSLTPLLNESSSAVSLPLTYNSVMDIQTLIERLLRLGICGPKYPNSSVMSVGAESLLPHAVHTQVDYIHCLVPDLLAITNYGFYWGKMDRYEAEKLLENKPEGTFLLRDSAQEDYLFTVSFCRYGRPLHARIEQSNHKFSFDPLDPWVFSSSTVCGLIEHYKDPSICMFYEPLLTNPLSRIFPFSLQHLSRAIICSCTTYDGINCLDLPKPIKNYLKEYHYKQRVRVRYLE